MFCEDLLEYQQASYQAYSTYTIHLGLATLSYEQKRAPPRRNEILAYQLLHSLFPTNRPNPGTLKDTHYLDLMGYQRASCQIYSNPSTHLRSSILRYEQKRELEKRDARYELFS